MPTTPSTLCTSLGLIAAARATSQALAPTVVALYARAALEEGHASAVTAGENAGRTLRHHHVVRLCPTVPDWTSAHGANSQPGVGRGVEAQPRRVVFVVTDATTRRPLQAPALACRSG